MNKRLRKAKRNARAVLYVRKDGWEYTRFGPPNFYRWKLKAQIHYLNRFGAWTGCCNGQPGMDGEWVRCPVRATS